MPSTSSRTASVAKIIFNNLEGVICCLKYKTMEHEFKQLKSFWFVQHCSGNNFIVFSNHYLTLNVSKNLMYYIFWLTLTPGESIVMTPTLSITLSLKCFRFPADIHLIGTEINIKFNKKFFFSRAKYTVHKISCDWSNYKKILTI